jgi:hypothetical protein
MYVVQMDAPAVCVVARLHHLSNSISSNPYPSEDCSKINYGFMLKNLKKRLVASIAASLTTTEYTVYL